MSTIVTDTLQGKTSATSITLPTTTNIGATPLVSASANSMTIRGEGSAVTNIRQGLVKAWVKFNGEASSIAPDDSFNVSGLTDNGTGDYIIAINNDMANDDYPITCNGSEQVFSIYNISNTSASSVRVYSQQSGSPTDAQEASVQITGDLA